MRDYNSSDRSDQKRSVLGDLTNRPHKRGFSLVWGESGLKSRDEHGKGVGVEDADFLGAKQVRRDTHNFVEEKRRTRPGVDFNEMPKDKQLSASSPYSNSLSNVQSDGEKFSVFDVGIRRDRDEAQNLTEVGDSSIDRRLPSLVTSAGQTTSCFMQRTTDENDYGAGKLASSKSGSIEWSRLPRSVGSNFPGLERCTALKDDNRDANLIEDGNSLRDCCCSFCLNAAHIWSDLHYQDIKARIATIKKSEKEASGLFHKCRSQIETHAERGNSDKSKQLESDLNVQWLTLFHSMEDIFAQEASHLHNQFVALKDLRENCKMNLEKINGIPSEKK